MTTKKIDRTYASGDEMIEVTFTLKNDTNFRFITKGISVEEAQQIMSIRRDRWALPLQLPLRDDSIFVLTHDLYNDFLITYKVVE